VIAPAKRCWQKGAVCLAELAEVYHLHRPGLRAGSLDQYDRACRSYCKFCEKNVAVRKINKQDFLAWMAHRLKEVSPRTVKRERGDLLTLWRFAWAEGMHKENPDTLRIPLIRCPKKSPTAWHLDQLQSWLEAAGRLPGRMKGSMIRKADWWQAYVLFLYCTAARLVMQASHTKRGTCPKHLYPARPLVVRQTKSAGSCGVFSFPFQHGE